MLCLVAALGWGSAGYASITNFTYSSDYTNFQCYVNYDYGNSVANIDGDQYASPGHMSGYFYTDSAEDPKATKSYQILNESGFTWAGYNVNVYMDRAFSISNAFATLPADWTVAVTQPDMLKMVGWQLTNQLTAAAVTTKTDEELCEAIRSITGWV